MKMKIYTFAILFALMSLIFVSCQKNDIFVPTPDPEPQSTLFQTIQGKWVMNTPAPRQGYRNTVSAKQQDVPQYVSLEFLSDSTYIIVLDNGDIIDGKFNITDSITIDLKEFGIISDINFAGASLNFEIATADWGLVSVTANKTTPLQDNAITTLICSKTWQLDSVETGPAIFNTTGGDGYMGVKLRFSQSGTYFVKQYALDTLWYAATSTWNWHPSKPNTYVYAFEGHNYEVTISEINDHSLRMKEDGIYYWHYDNGGNYIEEGIPREIHKNYRFVPVD